MITVIIPSYNRAHLLPEIIPSYLQGAVSRVVLVDDCSIDNTKEVIKKLQVEIPILDYIRLDKNSRQAYAKNVAIETVETPWIYFGDDDSVLYPNSLKFLLQTCQEYDADICGAKALYMNDDEIDLEKNVAIHNILLPTGKLIADLNTLETNFQYSVVQPISVPIVQASALVKTDVAKRIKFDPSYIGNSYREETDFFLRSFLEGSKIMYDSRAVQINLPRKKAKGGSHSSGKIKWYYYTVVNNHRFMNKNWSSVQKKLAIKTPQMIMEIKFLYNLFLGASKNIISKL